MYFKHSSLPHVQLESKHVVISGYFSLVTRCEKLIGFNRDTGLSTKVKCTSCNFLLFKSISTENALFDTLTKSCNKWGLFDSFSQPTRFFFYDCSVAAMSGYYFLVATFEKCTENLKIISHLLAVSVCLFSRSSESASHFAVCINISNNKQIQSSPFIRVWNKAGIVTSLLNMTTRITCILKIRH